MVTDRATTTLTLAHSPDSDDLVMWWPLTGQTEPGGRPVDGPLGQPAVGLPGVRFRTVPEDIQRLNTRAIERGDLDITAISAHAYPHIKHRYRITACGGSFGEGYGPKVVVAAGSRCEGLDGLERCVADGGVVAVPGVNTSAFLVLSLMLGRPFEYQEMLFSDIPNAVADGRADAGLLIHEAQLTSKECGLRVLADVGEWWGREKGVPLPLGLNVILRDLDERLRGAMDGETPTEAISRTLRASIEHARTHADDSYEHLVRLGAGRPEWADRALVDRYLSMYVGERAVDMGGAGREALRVLLTEGHRAGLCPDPGEIDVL